MFDGKDFISRDEFNKQIEESNEIFNLFKNQIVEQDEQIEEFNKYNNNIIGINQKSINKIEDKMRKYNIGGINKDENILNKNLIGGIDKKIIDIFIEKYLVINSKKNIQLKLNNQNNKKKIKIMNLNYKNNVLIKHSGNNFSILKKIIKSDIFSEWIGKDILFFDDIIVSGFIRSQKVEINDKDFMNSLKEIFNYIVNDYIIKRLKNKSFFFLISINSIVDYFPKSLIRYFTESLEFIRKKNKRINELKFMFLIDKSTELDRNLQIFINMYGFEIIDFEDKLLNEVLYFPLKESIPRELFKYFQIFKLPNWLISKWGIESHGEYTFEGLRKFLIKNYGFDIGQETISVNSIKKLEKDILGKLKGQDFIVKHVLQLFYGYMKTLRFEKPFVLFFAGPSGVGKTYFAELLAEGLGWNCIRENMGEYLESHSTAKLTGTYAGYAGFGETKTIVDKLQGKSNNVIIFDEIEKADPSIYKLLFSLLDEGIITDGKGDTAMLKGGNIIIFTSNIFTNFDGIFQSIKDLDPERAEKFKKTYYNLSKLEDKFIKTGKIDSKKSESILNDLNYVNTSLKTALTNKLDNAFVNRIQLFSLFNHIKTKEVIQLISELTYKKKIKSPGLNKETKLQYEKIWKNKKEKIFEKLFNSQSIKERGGREVKNITNSLLDSYIGIEEVNLF